MPPSSMRSPIEPNYRAASMFGGEHIRLMVTGLSRHRQLRQNDALAELASKDSFCGHHDNVSPNCSLPPDAPLVASTYSTSQCLLKHPDLRADLFPAAQLQAYAGLPRKLELLGHRMQSGHCIKQKTASEARARMVIARACSRKVARQIEPVVMRIAKELLVKASGIFDIVGDYGAVVPDLVLCHLLAMPPEQRALLRSWAEDLSRVADCEPQLTSRASEVMLQIREHVNRVRSLPLQDRHDGYGALTDCCDRITAEDVTNGVAVMLAAGNETVQDLIANTVLLLVEDRDLEQRVREEPELVEALIEETLRLESPVQATDRVAPHSVKAVGQCLHAWQRTTVHLAAANRDPKVFRQPDSVDLQRQCQPHVAFGLGANRCPAAALARMEGRVTITMLLQHTQGFRVIAPAIRKPPGILHGLKSLIIRL